MFCDSLQTGYFGVYFDYLGRKVLNLINKRVQ